MKHYQIRLYFISLLLIFSCRETLDPIPGVDQKMAEDRKSRISDIHYDLHFIIPEDKDSIIEGIIDIEFLLSDKGDIQIDFKESPDHLKETSINGEIITATIDNEHIVISSDHLVQGNNTISIDFIAGDMSLNRNPEYLYTLLVPARARTVFPVFDQPDMKATYQLTLDIPLEWEAVANGPLINHENKANRKVLSYGETKPISTYLFAFTAGKFKKWKDETTGMTMYYRETDSIKVARNAPEIFQLHQSSLEWLEEYTGIPYPFQKFDFALIPTFQYGGMEHPGAIFYRERSLMLDESASVNQQLSRASLIAHETAHMWFGDLVTMKWFDDVWLKEVFANFMAAKMVNPTFPEVNHDLRFLLSHYPRAYGVDRTAGSHPIQQPLVNLEDAGSVYGAIIYQKAPIVMRNLEAYIGEEKFQSGIRTYLEKYAFDNAVWDDLIDIMAGLTDQDLNQWNFDWVKKGHMPILSSTYENNRLYTSLLNEDQSREWPQSMTFRLIGEKVDTVIHATTGDLKEGLVVHLDEAQFIPNPNGRMYGYHQLNKNQITQMIALIDDSSDLVEKASYWMMLWESFLNQDMNVNTFYLSLEKQIGVENNPLILSYLSGTTQTIFWKFMSTDERYKVVSNLETLLYNRMTYENNVSLQRTIFQLYQSIVLTTEGVNALKKIWEKEDKQFSLKLSERDYESMAYELALRLPEEAEQIINEQIDRLNNPDSRDRMEFIRPVLSSDQVTRDEFFESLKDPKNRSVEPWVNQALSFLHHPLRSESSIKYITSSLEMIEEIQQTGDIFFPKGWLDNTLEGHNSIIAAGKVSEFLEHNPELPQHLKNKILQSADFLFRATHKD